ncbi:hypothetical protein LZC95_28550 [Pendulispora brunnea]|uniref:Uncharacterized protein n=1 Tax=Pendulispora brunnea TaxID=2905690 RepID=A0ABZ2JVJ9_9BACT
MARAIRGAHAAGMRSALTLVLITGFAAFLPAELQADEAAPRPVPAELLAKLARTSAQFEAMMGKASFTVTGHMDNKEGTARVTMQGDRSKVEILKYVEDGQDKTEEAKKRAAERAREPRKARQSRDEVHMPFLASEQTNYDFWVGDVDAHDPTHMRVFFHAKVPAENRMNGSAWVDERSGELLTASVTASKTPAFIDYIRAKFEFGEQTSMGPAISKLSFDTAGGFLFVRKHYAGSATFASYELSP